MRSRRSEWGHRQTRLTYHCRRCALFAPSAKLRAAVRPQNIYCIMWLWVTPRVRFCIVQQLWNGRFFSLFFFSIQILKINTWNGEITHWCVNRPFFSFSFGPRYESRANKMVTDRKRNIETHLSFEYQYGAWVRGANWQRPRQKQN